MSLALDENSSELSYTDLSSVQIRTPSYGFLADVLPRKITGREWIEKYKAQFDASCM